MSSERETCHWYELELKLHHVRKEWKEATYLGDTFYSLDGALDPSAEKDTHSNLMVSGPILDTYIKELGSFMLNKLSRGKVTGITQSPSLLLPWQAMVNVIKLAKRYGAEVQAETKKNKEKKITITITSDECSGNIWHPKRCGKNFLKKRFYVKCPPSDDTSKFAYNGCSKVVITKRTPLVLFYCTKKQKVFMTFYVQRYSSEGMSVDAALQAKLNTE